MQATAIETDLPIHYIEDGLDSYATLETVARRATDVAVDNINVAHHESSRLGRLTSRGRALIPSSISTYSRYHGTFGRDYRGKHLFEEGLKTGFAMPTNVAGAIIEASRRGDLKGYTDKKLKPSEILNRQWFTDINHELANTANGVLGSTSSNVCHSPSDAYQYFHNLSRRYDDFGDRITSGDTPFVIDEETSKPALAPEIVQKLRENRQRSSLPTAGCPVRHTKYVDGGGMRPSGHPENQIAIFGISGIELCIDGLTNLYFKTLYANGANPQR